MMVAFSGLNAAHSEWSKDGDVKLGRLVGMGRDIWVMIMVDSTPIRVSRSFACWMLACLGKVGCGMDCKKTDGISRIDCEGGSASGIF